MYEIELPEHITSVNNIKVHHWFYEEGDEVEAHTDLVEISSEDGPLVIMSPICGFLEEVIYHVGDDISSNDILGFMSVPIEKTDILG